MNVVAWIFGIAVIAVFSLVGVAKLLDYDRARERLGYSQNSFRAIGFAEVAGATGAIIGLIWRRFEYVAIAAGVGLCCLMLGALLAHARAEDDTKHVLPPLVMFVVTTLFIIFIAAR